MSNLQSQMYLSNLIGDYKIPLNEKFELIQKLKEVIMEDLEMYEIRLKESTSTGDLQELYQFSFKDEVKEISTRTFRFMATANQLDEVTSWVIPDEVEYVKCLGEHKLNNTMEDKDTVETLSFVEPKGTEVILSELENKTIGDTEAPIIFKIHSDIDPNESFLEVRGWHTSDLVSFGNYMLSRYPQKVQDVINKGLYAEELMPVTDADLANWRFLLEQNQPVVSPTDSSNDEWIPGDGTNLREEI